MKKIEDEKKEAMRRHSRAVETLRDGTSTQMQQPGTLSQVHPVFSDPARAPLYPLMRGILFSFCFSWGAKRAKKGGVAANRFLEEVEGDSETIPE